MKVLLKRVGATGHPVDPENPPFGFSVWRSRDKMAHGRDYPSCKHTLFKRPVLHTE